jgi:hypothetical protein
LNGGDGAEFLVPAGSAQALGQWRLPFDESDLLPSAGLLAAAVLGRRLGLATVTDQRVEWAEYGANCGSKALSVIGSALAGSQDHRAAARTPPAASYHARSTGVFRSPTTSMTTRELAVGGAFTAALENLTVMPLLS